MNILKSFKNILLRKNSNKLTIEQENQKIEDSPQTIKTQPIKGQYVDLIPLYVGVNDGIMNQNSTSKNDTNKY